MAAINTGKVVAGGLLAGLVGNAIDFVSNTYILAADWTAFAQTHNMDAAALTSAPVAGTWVAIDFLFGILLVWTYAAMRPRFGAGPKTAICAGLALYAGVTMVVFGFTMMGLMTMTMFVKGSIASLVSTVAASVAGASIYVEAAAPAAPAYAR